MRMGEEKLLFRGSFCLSGAKNFCLEAEIPLVQPMEIRRSREFHLDEQRRSAVRKNSVRVMNSGLLLSEIPLGQGAASRRILSHRGCLYQPSLNLITSSGTVYFGPPRSA